MSLQQPFQLNNTYQVENETAVTRAKGTYLLAVRLQPHLIFHLSLVLRHGL